MAISDLIFFYPENFKKSLFWEKWPQNQNFPKFQQKNGIYVVELGVSYQCAKFQLDAIVFDPQKGCFLFPIVPNDDVLHANAFFYSCSPLTYKKTNGTIRLLRRFCFRNMSLFKKKMKIWPFLTFLTWLWIYFRFFIQIKSNCKISSSSSKMDHETCVKRLIWIFWFGDVFWTDLYLGLS